MIFVDSSVWINYFNGAKSPDADELDDLLRTAQIVIGDLVLTEVLQGFRSKKDYETAKTLLLSLQIFDLLGTNMAIKAAENYRMLRSKGITIRKTADVISATFCIESDLPLLHADKDFQPFQQYLGLKSVI